MITTIVGWAFLISSWTIPYLIKDNQTRRFTGAILAAVACGIFLGALLSRITV
jgi:hypothetical protein